MALNIALVGFARNGRHQQAEQVVVGVGVLELCAWRSVRHGASSPWLTLGASDARNQSSPLNHGEVELRVGGAHILIFKG